MCKKSKHKAENKKNTSHGSQVVTYVFLGVCLLLFGAMLFGLYNVYSNLFYVDHELLNSIEAAAKDSLIESLTLQQSITLTISGVVATFLGLLLSGLTILRELKLERNTSEVETLKNETRKLIRELRSTYDVLIIKNSFSSLEKGAFSNTRHTMLLRLQSHFEDNNCNSELFDHHLLDELYSYPSYKSGYPTHDEAKEAYRKEELIGNRLLDKIGISSDYSSCCKRYITHLKCAEAGYNLLTNCADNDVDGVDKKTIYHSVVSHYENALKEDDFESDYDGFVQCRLGLLENWNEKYRWDLLNNAPAETLKAAKKKLNIAIKKNNCETWYYSLAATCTRLSVYEEENKKEGLLCEAEQYCMSSLNINPEAINAYVNLANIQIHRIINFLKVDIGKFKEGDFSLDTMQKENYEKYCAIGLDYCEAALRAKENSIGALRKKAAILCLKTKLNCTNAEAECLFRDAVVFIRKAEKIEEVCTQDDIPSETINSEKEALKKFVENSAIDKSNKDSIIKQLA